LPSSIIRLSLVGYLLSASTISQTFIPPNSHTIPINALKYEFNRFINDRNNLSSFSNKKKSSFKLSINSYLAFNSGHPNIDNHSEFYLSGTSSKILSARFEYINPWLFIEVEPYNLFQKQNKSFSINDTWHNNNNYNSFKSGEMKSGFKQSQLIIHYKGLGFGYGNINHWWGRGFHSAIALTSNAASQETYSVGTFKDIRFKKLSLGLKIIVIPYKNSAEESLYFSGLNTHITYYSDPKITLGLYRTYLSGNFRNLSENTNFKGTWTIVDAAKLVIEPLFGQSKKGLSYTVPGTPGFDPWNELLIGYINFNFPDDYLNLYFEISSDDNRANLTDLKAHWDHTLGYLIGFKKYFQLTNKSLFIGVEYLSLIKSNTEKFWRQYDYAYYTGSQFDYFTYEGRRMGAHSGSSSDDLIFMLGLGLPNKMILFSYNKERHGIKNKIYPEQKKEFNITYNYQFNNYHNIFLTYEFEEIINYDYDKNKISESKLLWIGYSITIR